MLRSEYRTANHLASVGASLQILHNIWGPSETINDNAQGKTTTMMEKATPICMASPI
jgi:hypothetical protein